MKQISKSLEKSEAAKKAKKLLRTQSGIFLWGAAIKSGVHPRTIYRMRVEGLIERLGRGMYRFTDLPLMGKPDLVTVAKKIPKGVVCLTSALPYHEMTTEIPRDVHIALPKGSTSPRMDYPPLHIFRFGGNAFSEGIEVHDEDGVPVKVYSPEKTLADCFKFRNQFGLDVALAALKFYRQRKRFNPDELMHYARVCRAENVMRPYVEATL
jgi:predicted transcriptional regulator of viral defense system